MSRTAPNLHDLMIVLAVVRGPKPPTPATVATLAGTLPAAPDGKPVDLRIRFVFTQTITPRGMLYDDNVAENVR